MTQARLDQARALHREGRIAEALAGYRACAQAEPGRASLWHLCSVAEYQLRQGPAARASIDRALALEPDQPLFRLHSGHVAEDAGEGARAIAEFGRATELKADWALAWTSLGSALYEAERMPEAVSALARAVKLDPRIVKGWNNLGLALAAMERADEAARAFESALAADPRYALAHFNLARLRHNAGDLEGALERVLEAVRLDPRYVDALLLAGDLYRKRQDAPRAIASYRAAVAAAPGHAKSRNALAEMLGEAGDPEAAGREYAATLERLPGSLRAALGAKLSLPAVYESLAHLEDCRERYRAGLDWLLADPGRFAKARPADLLSEARWTNFYLAYQGRNDRELQSRYGDFIQQVLRPAVPEWLEPRPARARHGARLRVGFLSHFFFDCTAGRYFESWVRGLDGTRFERFVYYTNPHVCDATRATAAAADHFRHLPGRPLPAIARQVLADELDVLVYPELGMHPDTFALASLRLAPVQCAGWGHPTTTGLPTIDRYLSCEAMEPEGAQDAYREKLALLPGLGTRYARPSGEEAGTRADLGLPADRHLYLVPQSVFKIHPDNDALLAEVLAADPQGVAVMFAAGPPALVDAYVKRVKPVLAARGVAVAGRLHFLPSVTHGAYLAVNRACDVMLDTLHWSGGNTSLDAIAMGLPVVTLPGALMRGRQSLAMLRLAGEPGLVAKDAADYVRLAVQVASDKARREAHSTGLLARGDRLFGQDGPVRAFESFLEGLA